jgi:hypothetical protein
LFIGSTTGERHRSADEENQTQGFHAHTNKGDVKRLQALQS